VIPFFVSYLSVWDLFLSIYFLSFTLLSYSLYRSFSPSKHLVRSAVHISWRHRSSIVMVRAFAFQCFIYFIFSFRSRGSFDYLFSLISGWEFSFLLAQPGGDFSQKYLLLVHDINGRIK